MINFSTPENTRILSLIARPFPLPLEKAKPRSVETHQKEPKQTSIWNINSRRKALELNWPFSDFPSRFLPDVNENRPIYALLTSKTLVSFYTHPSSAFAFIVNAILISHPSPKIAHWIYFSIKAFNVSPIKISAFFPWKHSHNASLQSKRRPFILPLSSSIRVLLSRD